MTQSLTVGVAGATGALGKEILAVLDRAPWRPDSVVALASARSEVPQVDFGEQSVSVDVLDEHELDGVDLLLLAVPPDVARAAAEKAIGAGVPVVDASGALSSDEDVPLVVPWVNPEALRELPPRMALSVPSPSGLLLASILGPLRRAGLEPEVTATVMVPASTSGRAGIDELSRQVTALFNSSNPPRKVFDPGLAFDLHGAVGEIQPDGWSTAERVAMDELRRLVGVEATVSVVRVPVFSGVSATVHLGLRTDVDAEGIGKLLEAGGVGVAKPGIRNLPRPRKVEGQMFAQVARIRRDPNGGGLTLWAAFDNLRGTAGAIVGSGAILLGDRVRQRRAKASP